MNMSWPQITVTLLDVDKQARADVEADEWPRVPGQRNIRL